MATNSVSEAIDLDRRRLLGTAALSVAMIGTTSLLPSRQAAAATADAIRPFRVDFPEEQLADLRRRIAATRWPNAETVSDGS